MDSRKIYLERLGVVLVVAQLALFAKCSVSAQDCLLAAKGREIPFRDDNGSPRLPNGTQAIITSYKFGCCGKIIAWQTYVQPGGRGHQGVYDITFQVWRPSPAVQEDGCYNMVGENRFTSISFGDDPDDPKGLVNETSGTSNILTVQPGDVVGYYTVSSNGGMDGIQLDTSQSIDSVWYHTDSVMGVPECPLPVGVDGGLMFTNAAPVLSVSVSSFPCPSTTTISPTFTVSPSSSSSLPPDNITTTTTSVPTKPTTQPPSIPVVVASVVVVVILVSSVLLVLLVVLLLWKRKRSQKNKKLEVAKNDLDLSNPFYNSCERE